MRIRVLSLAAILLLTTGAHAAECQMTTARPEVDTGAAPVASAPRFYVDDDGSLCEPCSISIWVYEESNGIGGLQRHDDVRDDTCGGAAGPGDTIIL